MKMFQFFKHLFSADDTDKSEKQIRSDQRRFDRYSVEFAVVVSGRDNQNSAYHEKTFLHDISGNGAMFMTQAPEKYFPGQLLKISIFLTGTHDVRARIQTEASVVRIHPVEMKDSPKKTPGAGIAVRFDRSFEFERIDNSEYR